VLCDSDKEEPVSLLMRIRVPLLAGAVMVAAFVPESAQAQASDVVYVAADLTTLPKMASMEKAARIIQASYPNNLKSQGVGGTVQLQLIVGVDGKVESGSVKVVSSSVPELGEAALDAAQKLEFTPGKVKDAAVRARVILPITYRAL
jgi:protein TonB